MICSSSFLPRNKGSPVQISYYRSEKARSAHQIADNAPHVARGGIGKAQNDFRSSIISTLNVGKEAAPHVAGASEIDELDVGTVEFRE